MQPAQKRRPRGTRPDPLNAARFPAWHGSREVVARDRFLNTAYTDRRHSTGPRAGIHSCYSGLQVTGHRYLPCITLVIETLKLTIPAFVFIVYEGSNPIFLTLVDPTDAWSFADQNNTNLWEFKYFFFSRNIEWKRLNTELLFRHDSGLRGFQPLS